jgi:hypothetical protein
MPTLQTIQKVRKLISDSKKPLSPTQICMTLGINNQALCPVLNYLSGEGHIEVISNGQISLVRNKSIEVKNEFKNHS